MGYHLKSIMQVKSLDTGTNSNNWLQLICFVTGISV